MTTPIDIFRGARAGGGGLDAPGIDERGNSPLVGDGHGAPLVGDGHGAPLIGDGHGASHVGDRRNQRRTGDRRHASHATEPHGPSPHGERRRPPHISERRATARIAARPGGTVITASFGQRSIGGLRAAPGMHGVHGSAGAGHRPTRTPSGVARPAPAIGVVHEPFLDDLLAAHPGVVDIVTVVPERFWTDRGRDAPARFRHAPEDIARIERLAGQFRLAAHSVGLAFGGSAFLDVAHARELSAWAERYGCEWVSEHLPGVVEGHDHATDAGLAAWNDDLLSTLTEQVEIAQDILGAPLLLENREGGSCGADVAATRSAFLDALTQTTGCRLLLDLHNLHLDTVNRRIDGAALVDRLDLDSIEEIHIGAGDCFVGGRVDPSDDGFPEGVWRLLQRIAPRCRKLRCVTFEFPASRDRALDHDAVLAQIERARSIVGVPTARH